MSRIVLALFCLFFLFSIPPAARGQGGQGSYQEEMTLEDDYYAGRAVAAEILKSYRVFTEDPELARYLNKICLAIVINSPRPVLFNGYHVQVLDSDEISAAERAVLFKEPVKETVNTLLKNGFAQAQEFNADAAALDLLAGAGYNPLSLIEILKILEKDQKNHLEGFNVTHPSPARRISNVEGRIGNYLIRETGSYRWNRFKSSLQVQ
jgi:predicted Zn-dependent protease